MYENLALGSAVTCSAQNLPSGMLLFNDNKSSEVFHLPIYLLTDHYQGHTGHICMYSPTSKHRGKSVIIGIILSIALYVCPTSLVSGGHWRTIYSALIIQ